MNQTESKSCPNGCSPGDALVIEAGDRLHGRPGEFRVMRCVACGLMRTSPRPVPSAMGQYYPSDYAPYHVKRVEKLGSSEAGWLKRMILPNDRTLPPVEPGRLLEIGCSAGAFLEEMRSRGWHCEGIEFSPEAAELAREKGFSVQSTTVEQAEPPTHSYDVIAAWMVLEHLHEPVAALERMRSWTTTNGYLVASVPDVAALERRLFGKRWYALQLPTHLFHFSPKTITRLMETAGWRVVKISHQRNCNNLLMSLQYCVDDLKMPLLKKIVAGLRQSPRLSKFRILLAWLLGAVGQSGRMEVWAVPGPARHDGPV